MKLILKSIIGKIGLEPGQPSAAVDSVSPSSITNPASVSSAFSPSYRFYSCHYMRRAYRGMFMRPAHYFWA